MKSFEGPGSGNEERDGPLRDLEEYRLKKNSKSGVSLPMGKSLPKFIGGWKRES